MLSRLDVAINGIRRFAIPPNAFIQANVHPFIRAMIIHFQPLIGRSKRQRKQTRIGMRKHIELALQHFRLHIAIFIHVTTILIRSHLFDIRFIIEIIDEIQHTVMEPLAVLLAIIQNGNIILAAKLGILYQTVHTVVDHLHQSHRQAIKLFIQSQDFLLDRVWILAVGIVHFVDLASKNTQSFLESLNAIITVLALRIGLIRAIGQLATECQLLG
mmetsp:Transcript_60636/g.96301  ORF Transcript_60636/g.96301 Transcript_60636/m.96301 type:complete len:215 (+) Transcript_60636:258-902(+)